jgi:hypothetical protein
MMPVERIATRAGEPARVARVVDYHGDDDATDDVTQIYFVDAPNPRQAAWNATVGVGFFILRRHGIFRYSMRAVGLLAALLAVPPELIGAGHDLPPEALTPYAPIPIIEARMTACYRAPLALA